MFHRPIRIGADSLIQTERMMVQVCEGNRTKNQMLEQAVDQYRDVFLRARQNFARVIEVSVQLNRHSRIVPYFLDSPWATMFAARGTAQAPELVAVAEEAQTDREVVALAAVDEDEAMGLHAVLLVAVEHLDEVEGEAGGLEEHRLQQTQTRTTRTTMPLRHGEEVVDEVPVAAVPVGVRRRIQLLEHNHHAPPLQPQLPPTRLE